MNPPVPLPIHSGILPWTRSCFVCGQDNPHGLRLRSRVEGDSVVLDYTTREADLGWRHIVHGGIAMTLVDEVMTWAAMLAVRRACVAAEMTSRLKKPIRVGERLRVEGAAVERKPRLILTEARILDEHGDVRVTATGKYVPMPDDQFPLCSTDFVVNPEAVDLDRILASGLSEKRNPQSEANPRSE
jgi:acyl-coenzyme A thioesterase PaaI-like protein